MALDPVTGGLIVGGGALLANMISGIVGRKERRARTTRYRLSTVCNGYGSRRAF